MQYSMHEVICNYKLQACIIVPVYTLYECYGHAEIVYAFQSIEKKVKKGSIKESPWRSG